MFVYFVAETSVVHYTTQPKAMVDQRNYDDDDWPICEKVLLSLSENVRPSATVDNDNNDAAVATNVQLCLAERVVPVRTEQPRRYRLPEQKQLKHFRRPLIRDQDVQTTVAARRTQTRLMTVRSAYTDGKYYAPGTPHVSRTVEELSLWPAEETPDNGYTYTVGTVLYDKDTGTCHLHGFADPRSRVAVDCDRLTNTLPRHGSTIKAYSELRLPIRDREGAPVLVLHHFQVFCCAALFK